MNTVAIQFLGRECERQMRIEAMALDFADLEVARSAQFAAWQISEAAFLLAVSS